MILKIRIQSIVFSILILLFSCKKEDNNSDYTGNSNYSYQSYQYISNLLPLQGSCLDSAGKLLFFQSPFLDSASYSYPIISSKILRADTSNAYSTVFDFQNQTFGYGNYSGVIYNGQFGWLPAGLCVSLAMTKKGSLFMATNYNSSLYKIENNNLVNYLNVDGIIAITSCNNNIYAATTPIYNSSGGIFQEPRIYEIDSTGQQSLFYEFPSSINFNNYSGGTSGGLKMYPFCFSISLKMDRDSSIYVAFGYDDIIYKIDKNKNLTTYISTISYPTSIDIDNNNRMYVVSAPGFSIDSLNTIIMTKPVQIYKVLNGTPSKIYEGNLFSPLYSGGHVTNDQLHRLTNSFYSLSVSPKNEIFLVSRIEGNITLIK